MNLSYEQQMILKITESLIQKYGPIISSRDFAKILGVEHDTIKAKICRFHTDMPKYTQLSRRRVFMAPDIAEWMVLNDLKFPK